MMDLVIDFATAEQIKVVQSVTDALAGRGNGQRQRRVVMLAERTRYRDQSITWQSLMGGAGSWLLRGRDYETVDAFGQRGLPPWIVRVFAAALFPILIQDIAIAQVSNAGAANFA